MNTQNIEPENNNNTWIPMPRFLLRKNALNSILKKLDLKDKECLEIGFGAGEILKLLASKGAKATGYDYSDTATQVALKRTRGIPKLYITTDEGDIKDESYDIVIALEVLEHIKDDATALQGWLKLIKPGGSLIISVPAHMSKWGNNDIWAGHYRRYEKQNLVSMCKDNNIRIEQLWNYGYPLTIVLDRLIHSSKQIEADNIKSNNTEKAELTKASGVSRDNKLIYRLLSNDLVLFPFYLIQKLFYSSDLGSCYIIHARKPDA